VANFVPLKQYMLYCLDRFVERYGMSGPFLEIGCGAGDVSAHLAQRGWSGVAIDASDEAIAAATRRLQAWPGVAVRRQTLATLAGEYPSIVMWDVLEHIDDDRRALARVAALLRPGGHVLIAVPSHPVEWRWDDEFYGHYRRYTVANLTAKLVEAGLTPLEFRDFTFPAYWAMRRVYTRLKRPPAPAADRDAATRVSALRNAWDLPLLSSLLDRSAPLWRPFHAVQHRLFGAAHRGHEFFVLARRPVT